MKLNDYLKQGKSYIIAEMSANHGGSKERALNIVDAAAKAGADCLKIQTYTADTMTLNSDKPYFQLTKGHWAGYSRYALYEEGTLPWEWQADIKKRCEENGMDFLSTAFDFSSVDFLESLDVECYKVASFELTDIPLLRYIAKTGKTMIISCGMGTKEEISEAVAAVREEGNNNIILLKCTSEYPAKYEDMNLNLIKLMKEDFKCHVGLSDHSLGDTIAVGAVAMGASVIEKHFCITRKDKTPDSDFSMEEQEFREMVCNIRKLESALGNPAYQLSETETAGRINRRSLFIKSDIKKGEAITVDNIAIVRPAHGLHPRYYYDVLGKIAVKDLEAGDPLEENDFE